MAIVAIGIVGTVLLVSSKAATFQVSSEPETGLIGGGAVTELDVAASGGSAVKFGGLASSELVAPTAPYGSGEVGASNLAHPDWTGDMTFDDAAAASLPSENFTLTHPLTGQTSVIPVRVIRARTFTDALRFQLTNTTILLDDCRISPVGSGYHAVYIEYGPNDAWITDDIMKPRVIFNRCSWTTATKDWVNGVLGHSYWVLNSQTQYFQNGFDVGGMSVFYHNNILGGTSQAGAHTDGIQFYGGTNVSIVENWIDIQGSEGETGAINFSTDFAELSNSTIQANTLKGGTYTLYLDRTGSFEISGITVKDNRWYDGSYMYGPVVNDNVTNLTWTGNKYLLSGTAINP
jgi:hypothetical protein